ncbi:MAG: iron-containing alcohol dehydrogenase, partial [Burkholderiales bacterium]
MEIERIGAKRVMLLTTRSLADGALIRKLTSALGDRFAGRFSEIRAHSPREAVIAGAALAREVEADHLLAVGGGSVIDATKTMLLALWRGVRDVDALSALAQKRGAVPPIPLDSDRMRMTAVPTTLSAAEFTAGAGVTDVKAGDAVAWTGVPGAYAQMAAVPADRLVKLPAGVSPKNGAAAML